MTDVYIPQEHNDFRLMGTLAHLDTGPGKATLEIYDGDQPEGGGAAPSPLVTFTFTKPAGVLVSHKLSLEAEAVPLVMRTGTATWGRVKTANGALNMDVTVSLVDGPGHVWLDKIELLAGGSVQLVMAIVR